MILLYQNKMDMKKLGTLLIGIMLLTSMSLMANENKKTASENSAEAQATPTAMKSITGKVVDLSTGEALAGVTVLIDGTDMVAFTDFDGKFKFSNVNLNAAKISASFISYEKSLLNISPSSSELVVTMKSVY
ncbi:MAG: hypothetical protein CVT98_03785 [Bacteroidetes bacterium HGW-Bacteroidetes-15]|nr:MAG: hypothetical protein CVT98_03785 [Bacteroidetes bacterium HGW-Bacteroidetes-15]